MRFLPRKSAQGMQEFQVTIGKTNLSLPFAEFLVPDQPHILITAGLDGDEYTGIEAAYQLISNYLSTTPPVSLTILPLVNIPGFYKGVSYNPLDNLYPKHVFPGKKNGTHTEQLMSSLTSQFFNNVSVWIDLHSGSLHESLTPFVLAYQTKKREVDQLSDMILSHLEADKKVYHSSPSQKITSLAKRNITYLLLEAGEGGKRETKETQRLLVWTNDIVTIVAANETSHHTFSAYTFVDEYRAPKQGLWYQSRKVGEHINKGEVLGLIKSEVHDEMNVIQAKTPGEILWQRSTLPVGKQDIIIGMGVKEQIFKKEPE